MYMSACKPKVNLDLVVVFIMMAFGVGIVVGKRDEAYSRTHANNKLQECLAIGRK